MYLYSYKVAEKFVKEMNRSLIVLWHLPIFYDVGSVKQTFVLPWRWIPILIEENWFRVIFKRHI